MLIQVTLEVDTEDDYMFFINDFDRELEEFFRVNDRIFFEEKDMLFRQEIGERELTMEFIDVVEVKDE